MQKLHFHIHLITILSIILAGLLTSCNQGTSGASYNKNQVNARQKSLFTCLPDKSSTTPNECGCLVENNPHKNGDYSIWYIGTSVVADKWTNWCSQSGEAADPGCTYDDNNRLSNFNKKQHCGFSNWHLPTAPDNSAIYVNQMGGDWGRLGTYAINNGWQPGTSLIQWLSAEGFTNIKSNAPWNYWSATSFDTRYYSAWYVAMIQCVNLFRITQLVVL